MGASGRLGRCVRRSVRDRTDPGLDRFLRRRAGNGRLLGAVAHHAVGHGTAASRPHGSPPGGGRSRPPRTGGIGGVVLALRDSRPRHARAREAADPSRRHRPLSLRAEPDVRRGALHRRRPGPVLREPAAPDLRGGRMGRDIALRAPVRGARPAPALRRGLRGLLRGRAPVVAAPAPVARRRRDQRSIKPRKSGAGGVGSSESAFSTANSAMRSTAQGKCASLRLR